MSEESREQPLFTEQEMTNPQLRPLHGTFFQTDKLIEFLSTEEVVVPTIPLSNKSNVYFLLQNSENLERKSNGKTMDNCGTWDSKSASTKTAYFVKRVGKMMSVTTRV